MQTLEPGNRQIKAFQDYSGAFFSLCDEALALQAFQVVSQEVVVNISLPQGHSKVLELPTLKASKMHLSNETMMNADG